MKAQAEFIVIVGLVLVVAAVVFFAQSGMRLGVSPVPPGVYEEQKAVANTLTNLVREASDRALMTMETHGGYPTGDFRDFSGTETVMFRGQNIPVWAFCENPDPPSYSNLKNWFEGFVEDYVKAGVYKIDEIYRRNVSINLSGISAEANILDNKIAVRVTLPTEVDGYLVQKPMHPYTAELPTNMGEIYKFAKDYVTQNANSDADNPMFGRFIETYTIGSLYFSRADKNGKKAVPTTGVLVECGDVLHRVAKQIDRGVQDVVGYVLDQMLWWQNMPVDRSEQKTPAIQSVNGNVYPDISPKLYLPDGFEFDLKQYVHLTNNIFANSGDPMTVAVCVNRYHVGYDIPFPYVVSVHDPLSGYDFNFAVYAYVENKDDFMAPGHCDSSIANKGDAPPCENTGCSARVTVNDEESRPVEGAAVVFGECGLGSTDSEGVAQGTTGCSDGELVIYKDGHESFSRNVSLSEINSTFLLRNVPSVTFHFRKVKCAEAWSTGSADCFLEGNPSCIGEECKTPVQYYTLCEVENADKMTFVSFTNSKGDEYPVTNIDTDSVDPSCGESTECEQCQQNQDTDACTKCSEQCLGTNPELVSSALVDYIPANSYVVEGESMRKDNYKSYGGFVENFDLENRTGDVYIYMPEKSSPVGYYLKEEQKQDMKNAMENQCGIKAVTEKEYVTKRVSELNCDSCYVLRIAATGLADYGCMSEKDIGEYFWDCNCDPEGGCGLCCDKDGLTGLFGSFPQKCNTEVVCK